MVIAIFNAGKFIDSMLIYCRLKFNKLKQSYPAKTMIAIGNSSLGAARRSESC